MPEQAQQNPFAGLLTVDTLRQQEAQNAIQSAGNNQYAAQMNLAMLNLRENLVASGRIAPSPEMLRAQRNTQMLQNASHKYGEMVQNGRADPRDAMGAVLAESMQELLAAGDYESAAMIAPHLYAQRKEDEELDKIRGATYKSRMDASKVPSEIAKNEAQASLYNRTDPNLRAQRGGGAGGSGTTNKSDYANFRNKAASTASTIQKLGDLNDLYARSPGITSDPGQVVSAVQDAFKGGKSLFFADPKNSYASDIEQSWRRSADGKIQAVANSLNVDKSVVESITTETAYTLARAYDNRISNADFENALNMLGKAKDPKAARAAFTDLAFRLNRTFKNEVAVNPDFADEPGIELVKTEYDRFMDRAKGRTPAAKTEALAKAKAVADMTDEELEALANGG